MTKYIKTAGNINISKPLVTQKKIKADQPHPRHYPHTPTDY